MSRMGRNTVTLVAFAGLDGVLGWVQLKWLAVHLGTSGMGLFAVLFSVGAVLALVLNAGLVLLVTRYTASLESEGRPGLAARVALACLAYSCLVGGACTLAVFACPLAWTRLWAPLHGSEGMLPWVVFFFASTAARQFLYAVWNGRRRMEWPALVDLLQMSVVTARLFLGGPLDLATFFRWNAWTSLAALVGCAALLVPSLARSAAGRFQPSEARALRSYGLWSAATALTGVGFDYVDRLFLAARISAVGVSYFHVPARWLQFLRRLLAQPLLALFPELARETAAGSRREAFSAFMEGFSLLGLGAGLALALAPGAFIRLLASPAFDRGIPILKMLALVPPLMGLYAPLNTALRARGHMRQGAVSDVLWVVFYLGLGVPLLPALGGVGLAVGQVGASLVCLGWNVWAGRQESWMPLPWGSLARQWIAAGVGYVLASRLPGGEMSWLKAAAGVLAFVILVRLLRAVSAGAREQLSARVPEPLRAPLRLLLGA